MISDALHTNRMDPTWMLPSFVDQNPLVWMAEVNGMVVDLREMPRAVQAIACEKGLIPYIPPNVDSADDVSGSDRQPRKRGRAET